MGMIVTLNTNGTLIDGNMADFFAAHRPRRVNITLYGKNAETYDRLCHFWAGYELAVRGIRLLRQKNIDIKINGSLTKENKDDAQELVVISRQLDAPIHIDTYMYPAGREPSSGFHYGARLSPEEATRSKVEILKTSFTEDEYILYREKQLQDTDSPAPEQPALSVQCRA